MLRTNMKLIHWIVGSLWARRRAKTGRYGVEVLCAGWVELPKGFKAGFRAASGR